MILIWKTVSWKKNFSPSNSYNLAGRAVQNYENFESFEERKDKFNLEDALEIEKHLLKICESLRKQEDPTGNCEDWWMITDPSNYTLIKLSLFFKNKQVIDAIMETQKLELVSISFLQFLSFENSLDQSLWVPFKNLLFFIHQNLLILNKLLLERLPKSGKPNSWAAKIKKICESKLIRLYKDREETLQALKINLQS